MSNCECRMTKWGGVRHLKFAIRAFATPFQSDECPAAPLRAKRDAWQGGLRPRRRGEVGTFNSRSMGRLDLRFRACVGDLEPGPRDVPPLSIGHWALGALGIGHPVVLSWNGKCPMDNGQCPIRTIGSWVELIITSPRLPCNFTSADVVDLEEQPAAIEWISPCSLPSLRRCRVQAVNVS